jgi:hypothetical protein
MCIKRVYRKRSNVEWYDVNKGEALKHGMKDIFSGLYWNENEGRWCVNKSKKKMIENGEIAMFDFCFYGLDDLKKKFGNKIYEKVGMFLTRQYQMQLFKNKVMEWKFVYWSYSELEVFLGYKCELVLKKMVELGLIEIKMEALKYDNRKVTRIIRMNKKFVDREGDVYKKSFVKDSGFEKVMKSFYSKREVGSKGVLKVIEDTLESSKLEVDDLKGLFTKIWEDKLKKDLSCLENDYAGKRDKKDAQKRLDNKEAVKIRYDRYLERYFNGIVDLQLMKKGGEKTALLGVNVQTFGKRVSHVYSNMPKQMRKQLTIDGEAVVELDIKSSQPSFLYVLIRKWFESKFDEDFIADPNQEVIDSTFKLPFTYIEKFDVIRGASNLDIYVYMAFKMYGINWKRTHPNARTEMKTLFYKLIFGNPKDPIKGKPRQELISFFFGFYMYEFISALALNDLGLELKKKYANLSSLLQREEASFMADVMSEMYNNGVKFIPIYDSLVIKASDREKAKFHFNNIIRSHKLEGILSFS